MKEYFLITEVAEIFGVSESTVKRLIRARELCAIKLRGCTRVPRRDLEKLQKRAKRRSTRVHKGQTDLLQRSTNG
ncbi:MAG: hypothetical protein AUK55_11520 [Syntrophobacteraceae bacterium CG2_30_61_12]|nr:MAG: hypothetical protein AUK55_11520 [Syntrophobacteraceae bacterium CG2_30_61_12]